MNKQEDFQRITSLLGDLIIKYGFETAMRMMEKTTRMAWSIRDFQRQPAGSE